MNPLTLYQQQLSTGKFKQNLFQERAVILLDELYSQLTSKKIRKKKLFNKLSRRKNNAAQGFYFWGSVGVGKTWLMDLFYESLPENMRFRMHFHRFMAYVHQQMKLHQGKVNPLKTVAKEIIQRSSVICLDEFLVNDIADAMILAGLLEALFAEGMVLVTTSNTPPEELYRNGLQRQRFIPAIKLLQQQQHVIHLTAEEDYRMRPQISAESYFYPLNAEAEKNLHDNFCYYAGHAGFEGETLYIHERPIKTVRCSQEVVWFDFKDICNIPRSQLDYLEIARLFRVVIVSNIPQIAALQKSLARYLINLVDVLYDARRKLIISAEMPPEAIYPEGELAGEFKRTYSRLIEMQGKEYFQDSLQK